MNVLQSRVPDKMPEGAKYLPPSAGRGAAKQKTRAAAQRTNLVLPIMTASRRSGRLEIASGRCKLQSKPELMPHRAFVFAEAR